VSLRAMLADVLEDELTVDRRLPTTLAALLFRPGQLTLEYVNGRIVRYIRPFRLYLVTSVVFFLLLSFTSLRFVRDASGPFMPGAPAPEQVQPPGDGISARDGVGAGDGITAGDGARSGDAFEARDRTEAGDRIEAGDRTEAGDGARSGDAFEAGDRASEPPAVALERIDSVLARVTTTLADPQLPEAARSQLRQSRNDLIRQRAALARGDEAGGAPGAEAPGVADDPMAFLDGLNFSLRHPALDSAAAAKLRQFRTMEPRQAIERAVGDFIGVVPTLMFILLPLFALVLKALFIRRRRYYAEHFVFLLHTHAFIYLLFTLLLGLVVLGWFRAWVLPALFVWILAYTFLAMRRVYGQSRSRTLAKWAIMGWVYFWILLAATPFAFLASVLLL
jgi:hypothetical protein